MADIVALPGKALSADQTGGKPNPETIACLERLLDRARTGSLQVVAYAGVNADGGSSTGWSSGTKTDAIMLMGALNIVSVDMAQRFVDREPI